MIMGWVTSIGALFQMKIQNINLIQKSKMSRAHPAKVGEIFRENRRTAARLDPPDPRTALPLCRRIALSRNAPGRQKRPDELIRLPERAHAPGGRIAARILPSVNGFFSAKLGRHSDSRLIFL